MSTGHVHETNSGSRTSNGTLYEVCWCGAVRVTRDNKPEPWHACESCSTEVKKHQ